jgi:hypothetical protein
MATVVAEGSFADLRRLADWFSRRSTDASTIQIARIVGRLGTTALPFLGRELTGPDPRRRDAARDALATLATTAARDRVIALLSSIAQTCEHDDIKVSALGLLAELGEHPTTQFHDPTAIQRRSALALAAQLTTPADVASAVDLMIRQLGDHDMLQMIDILLEAAPSAAAQLIAELLARLDLSPALRDRVAALHPTDHDLTTPTNPRARPTQVAVLVDAAARIVVVASRKVTGERRWRRWAVLVGASGRIEDCLHEDDAGADDDAAPLIANLCADGYRVASTELDHARTVVTAAVRHATRHGSTLSSAYYLGRDLLELGNEHLTHGRTRTPSSIGQAIELLATGDPIRAQAIIERCTRSATRPAPNQPAPNHPADIAATLAACLLARGQIAEAVEPLERAVAEEPTWPLHHWNLASALHALGDSTGCYHALRRFVATSSASTGNLIAWSDPDQSARLAHADRLLGELERSARLAGAPIAARPARRRRRQTSKKRRA